MIARQQPQGAREASDPAARAAVGAYALKYLELFSSLLDLHHSEFDGLENSILQALHQGSFSFFPIGAYLAYIRSMLSCDPQVHPLRIDALTMSS